jgi:hypothetical protein
MLTIASNFDGEMVNTFHNDVQKSPTGFSKWGRSTIANNDLSGRPHIKIGA